LYKLFSGELAASLVKTATGLEWISAVQKGFLPGINAIQEHTEVLTAAIKRAKKLIEDLSICFLVLTNAFGSLPHAVLCSFFDSLPVPDALKRILKDIYKGNQAESVVTPLIIELTRSRLTMSRGLKRPTGKR
jgi:hypothetical protein